MTDFALARENMIESQVRPNGVTDHRIIAAMAGVAREGFVPETRRAVAYMDEDVDLGGGRSLMEAMAFAKLLQAAEIKPGDKVLLVGAATGYGAAVVSQLAASVVALESDSRLAALCRSAVTGLANVQAAEGALERGWAAAGPYDVILVEGQAGDVPGALTSQLADHGRLVAVVGEADVAKAQVWTKHGGKVAVRNAFDASVAALPGLEKKRPAFVF